MDALRHADDWPAPFVAVAAFLFRRRVGRLVPGAFDYTLSVRLGVGHDPDTRLRPTLERHAAQSRLLAVGTARQGAALELNYGLSLHNDDSAAAFVAELNAVEGVQNVDLRRI